MRDFANAKGFPHLGSVLTTSTSFWALPTGEFMPSVYKIAISVLKL